MMNSSSSAVVVVGGGGGESDPQLCSVEELNENTPLNDEAKEEKSPLLSIALGDILSTGERMRPPVQMISGSLESTFLHMESRKLRRFTSGKYQDNVHYVPWFFMYALAFGGFLVGFYFWNKENPTQAVGDSPVNFLTAQQYYVVTQILVVVLVGGVLFPMTARMSNIANGFTIYWTFCVLEYFLITTTTFFSSVTGLLLLIFLTWMVYFSYVKVMPWMVKQVSFCFGWRNLQPSLSESAIHLNEIRYEYLSLGRFFWCLHMQRHQFMYRGGLKNGKPHGQGEWRDDSFYGESLVGYWFEGLPRGPFQSCEHGTGNAFINLRVGYCTNRRGWYCNPKDEYSDTLRYGFSAVECTIAGVFYSDFPLITETFDLSSLDQTRDPIRALFSHLLHYKDATPDDIIVISARRDGELSVSGHRSNADRATSCQVHVTYEKGVPVLSVKGIDDRHNSPSPCLPDEENNEENHRHHHNEEGRDSNSIELDVEKGFDGEEGDKEDENKTNSISPNDDEYEDRDQKEWVSCRDDQEVLIFLHGYNIPLEWAVKKLAQLLANGGFPAHIKPIIFSFPTGKVFSYFQAIDAAESEQTIADFRQFLSDLVMGGVQSVHIMTHSMGIRMFLAAMANPDVYSFFQGGSNLVGRLRMRTCIFCNADYPLGRFRDVDYERIRAICSSITIYVDTNDNALWYSELFTRKKSLGRLTMPLVTRRRYRSSYSHSGGSRHSLSRPGDFLDVDIIDTSGLKDNMHSVRHSAFNINRVMVDDIYAAMVEGKRAAHRAARLVNTDGNFFSFMHTPSQVTGSVV